MNIFMLVAKLLVIAPLLLGRAPGLGLVEVAVSADRVIGCLALVGAAGIVLAAFAGCRLFAVCMAEGTGAGDENPKVGGPE